jgi:hypothetical protein
MQRILVANVIDRSDAFTKPKVSKVSDAYDLAKSFAADFSQLLVTGSSPFETLPSLPSVHSIGSMLGVAKWRRQTHRLLSVQ